MTAERSRGSRVLLLVLSLCVAACERKVERPDLADAEVGAERSKTSPERTVREKEAAEARHTRALHAVRWGVPIVGMDAMRQAFFRDAHARYGDVVYWSKPSDWKNQTATPNAATNYVYFNFNTKDGPVVLEVPPAKGAGLFGSVLDAWQTPRADVGPQGKDEGKGGKYVLLPPGYGGQPPAGYVPVRFDTWNGYGLLRVIREDGSPQAAERAVALAKRVRVYPLSEAAKPPDGRAIDMSGKLFDGIVRYDESFFTSLARMVDEEPALPRDAPTLAFIRTLGIEKGKRFEPQPELAKAAAQVHQELMGRLPREGEPFWPDRKWNTPSDAGVRTGFSFLVDGKMDIESRAMAFFLAYAPPQELGKASLYLIGTRDRTGQQLSGAHTYRLHVPAKVPAKQFWAATVYDASTAGFIREAPRVELSSYDALAKNADGSVDLYFGPKAPSGKAANWVYAEKDKPFFSLFRFYGPEPALADRSFVLGDFEKL